MSNTKNTTYYGFSTKYNRIVHIYYYRNHHLFKSVDFGPDEVAHTHYWPKIKSGGGRERHDLHNTFELSQRDKRLIEKAQEFNNQING